MTIACVDWKANTRYLQDYHELSNVLDAKKRNARKAGHVVPASKELVSKFSGIKKEKEGLM